MLARQAESSSCCIGGVLGMHRTWAGEYLRARRRPRKGGLGEDQHGRPAVTHLEQLYFVSKTLQQRKLQRGLGGRLKRLGKAFDGAAI